MLSWSNVWIPTWYDDLWHKAENEGHIKIFEVLFQGNIFLFADIHVQGCGYMYLDNSEPCFLQSALQIEVQIMIYFESL